MRAALYARFSSELQDERSIADQVALCREHVERAGGEVVATFEDRAISGGSVATRPGLLALLDAATHGAFDTVVSEALDRLSRDLEDIAGIDKRLRYAGVRIVTLAEGAVESLHIGLKGTMNALFLEDLARKTRRGQIGRVKAGRIPGGVSFGYAVVKDGTEERGRRVVNPVQAAVVLRIFEDYCAGRSPFKIAQALNREGVPSPRGGLWNVSTINGSRGRQNGILNNELYIGCIVYGRQRFIKHPATGKRQARKAPPADWLRQDVPELRIVPQDLWETVQAMRRDRGGVLPPYARRPKRVFSGLLFCGCCGGSYIMASRNYLRCSTSTNKGTCENRRTVKVEEVEARVLEGLRRYLLDPEVVRDSIAEYRRAIAAQRLQDSRQRAGLERAAADAEAKARRLMGLLEDGIGDPRRVAARMADLEAERKAIAARLEAMDAPAPVELHPRAAEHYAAIVGQLKELLAQGGDDLEEVMAVVRGMVSRIDISPGGRGEPVGILVGGTLSALLSRTGSLSTTLAVAGARFGQCRTFSLDQICA